MLSAMMDQHVSDGTVKSPVGPARSFGEYLRDIWARWWFYSSMTIAISELVLVISDVQVGVALFFRMVFGLGLLGLIPGFLTTLVLFPRGQLNAVERIALSIFMSVLVSITIGVMLGLGPYFQATNNIIALATYVLLVDVAASYRAYQFHRASG